MTDLQFHPVASIFPMIEDLADLTADIREHGLREAIWLHRDGRIIDGRNRYLACKAAGVAPSFRTYLDDDSKLVAFIVSLNLHRRHLSESQRAMVAGKLANLGQGQPSGKPANLPVTQSEAADALGVSERSVRSARKVQRDAEPEVVEAVERGELAVSRAARLAVEPPEVQREAVRSRAQLMQSSESNEWYTPVAPIEAVRKVLGTIDLDPASCAKANETVQASRFYSKEDDGLAQDWKGRVWLNPPYGREANAFTDKLTVAVGLGDVPEAICVLASHAVHTNWFRPLWDAASAFCFTYGRLQFISSDGAGAANTHGSVFCYFGQEPERFAKEFAEIGSVVTRWSS